MPLYCPLFPKELDPCNIHSCLFNRNGGCAIVLAATLANDNQVKIDELNQKTEEIAYKIRNIEEIVEKLKRELIR